MPIPKYHSAANNKFRARRKVLSEPSVFAQQTFEAFAPFINIFDCGGCCFTGKYHLISKEDWELNRRHKAGERNLVHWYGAPFNPYLDIIRNIYSPDHVQKHLSENEVTYYTSGRKGQGLLYLDVDAHHGWQKDEYRAKQLLQDLFPSGYFRASQRGQNGYLKVTYTSIAEFNWLADHVQTVLRRYFLHAGIYCDFEIKGTITHKAKSGSLAKLPFLNKRDSAKRDVTDSWDGRQLELFKNCPTVNARRVQYLVDQVEPLIDEDRVATFSAHREQVTDEYERQQAERAEKIQWLRSQGFRGPDDEIFKEGQELLAKRPQVDAEAQERAKRRSSGKVVASQHANRGVGDAPVRHSSGATPFSRTTTHRTSKPGPARGNAADGGDAFVRNQRDLLPFVREFYKKHRCFPSTEDALSHLRESGLFSGDWTDREHARAKRVEQILAYTERTFDPNLLGGAAAPSLSLTLGKFDWWVRQKFGNGMTIEAADLRSFDPVTMTVTSTKVQVPARFVETFLVVADVCLNLDPLENKAVPTSRFKKIWELVKGGANWNQQYFQVVRDRLDRMGVISIFDREHKTGKAWRWEPGMSFPADNWKDHQRKIAKQVKKRGLGKQSKKIFVNPATLITTNYNLHNTLYQTVSQVSEIRGPFDQKRPPPD